MSDRGAYIEELRDLADLLEMIGERDEGKGHEPMTRNAALLRQVGDAVYDHPGQYNQGYWAERAHPHELTCRTAACVAGWTVRLQPNFERFEFRGLFADRCVMDGKSRSVELEARRLLGLSKADADRLFSASWEPDGDAHTPLHQRVRDALYALADGVDMGEVTAATWDDE